MSSETEGSEEADRPPNPAAHRDERRETVIIDAKAEDAREEAAPEEPVAAPQSPKAARPQPAPRSLLAKVALGLAGFALLMAIGVGAHVFVTTDGAIVDLRAASAKMQSAVASLNQSQPANGDADTISTLQQRLAALEAATQKTAADLAAQQAAPTTDSQAGPTSPAVDLGPLAQRISALEAQVQALAAGQTSVQSQVQPLATGLASVQAQMQPLAAGMAGLQAQIQPLAASVAAAKADVGANQAVVRQAVSASDAAALVVVAQALVSALDTGAPFTSEVAAAQALGADAARIATLQPYAAKGVPTPAMLAQSFAPLAAPILTGAEQREPQNLLEQMERRASSLVQIRPVGDAAATGTDRTALIARIEGALAKDDVDAALAAWAQLPPAAQQVTADWAAAAKTRAGAADAARSLLADAIGRLGQSKP